MKENHESRIANHGSPPAAGGGFVKGGIILTLILICAVTALMGLSGTSRHSPVVNPTRAMISQVSEAVDLFKLEFNRNPERLDDLVRMPSYVDPGKWPPGGFLKKSPRDQWGREFLYRSPGTGGQSYDIISFGKDGVEGGEGYAEDLWNHDFPKR